MCLCVYRLSRHETMLCRPHSLFSLPTVPSKAVRLEHAMEPLSAVVETGLAGSFFLALHYSLVSSSSTIIAVYFTNKIRPMARIGLPNLF